MVEKLRCNLTPIVPTCLKTDYKLYIWKKNILVKRITLKLLLPQHFQELWSEKVYGKKEKYKLTISNFNNFILHFHHFLGDKKIKWCEECSERLIRITNYKNKYCKVCFKTLERERQKVKWHNNKHKYRS